MKGKRKDKPNYASFSTFVYKILKQVRYLVSACLVPRGRFSISVELHHVMMPLLLAWPLRGSGAFFHFSGLFGFLAAPFCEIADASLISCIFLSV
jgi:hypothetical protein